MIRRALDFSQYSLSLQLLSQLGLQSHVPAFFKHELEDESIPQMQPADLINIGLSPADAERFLSAFASANATAAARAAGHPPPPPTSAVAATGLKPIVYNAAEPLAGLSDCILAAANGHVPTTTQEAFEIVAKAGRATPEEIFSLIANTGRHHMCINIMRELVAGDKKAWLPFLTAVLLDEDDSSLMALSLSDILAVDISKITDPNLRLLALASPFVPENEGRTCRWGLNAVQAMQVASFRVFVHPALTAAQFFTVFKKWKEIESDCKALEITKHAVSIARRAKPSLEIAGAEVLVSKTLSPLPCAVPPPALPTISIFMPMLPITAITPTHSSVQTTPQASPVVEAGSSFADEFTELLYDTSMHGATNKAFHNSCDNKGPTIGVFVLDNASHLWGWYTPASWSSLGEVKAAPGTILFTSGRYVTHRHTIFQLLNPNDPGALNCTPLTGPSFGAGLDLCVNFDGPLHDGLEPCYSRLYSFRAADEVSLPQYDLGQAFCNARYDLSMYGRFTFDRLLVFGLPPSKLPPPTAKH